MEEPSSRPPSPKPGAVKMFLIGGLLPVAAFAIVEQVYGTIGGLIAGIILGLGEMIYEYRKEKRVQAVTIGSNLLVVILGVVSLFEEDGTWFKMQPAILLAVFAIFLFVSSILKRPFLVAMVRKQNPLLPESAVELLRGMNFRISFVFLGLAALSAYAGLHWSTAAWATLKGIGTPALLILYMAIEIFVLRAFRKPGGRGP